MNAEKDRGNIPTTAAPRLMPWPRFTPAFRTSLAKESAEASENAPALNAGEEPLRVLHKHLGAKSSIRYLALKFTPVTYARTNQDSDDSGRETIFSHKPTTAHVLAIGATQPTTNMRRPNSGARAALNSSRMKKTGSMHAITRAGIVHQFSSTGRFVETVGAGVDAGGSFEPFAVSRA